MNNYLVTVVLPIYNVEKYLDRCMESVTKQTYQNLEIIMVDDGATDSCPQKCDEWAKKDKRIKVIHKKNAGLGMARNTGIENATGDYIVFFDSDDYIALDAIEKAVNSASMCNADLVTFGFSFVNDLGEVTRTVIPSGDKEIYSGDEVLDIVLPDLLSQGIDARIIKGLWISAWVNMYSMKLINEAKWRFVSERLIISEDVYSMLDLYSNVSNVVILSDALYFYCENGASLTHAYRKDRFEKLNSFYKQCYTLSEHKGYSTEIIERLAYPYIANVIGALKIVVSNNMKYSEVYKIIKSCVNDDVLVKIAKSIDINSENSKRKLLLMAIRRKKPLLVFGIMYVNRIFGNKNV